MVFLPGVRDHRDTWTLNVTEPVSGNYYPVTSRIMLKSSSGQDSFVVLNDRAQVSFVVLNDMAQVSFVVLLDRAQVSFVNYLQSIGHS